MLLIDNDEIRKELRQLCRDFEFGDKTVTLTTVFLDRHNDYIQVGIGEWINEIGDGHQYLVLFHDGLHEADNARAVLGPEIFDKIIEQYAVDENLNGDLAATTSPDAIKDALIRLIQCVIALDGMMQLYALKGPQIAPDTLGALKDLQERFSCAYQAMTDMDDLSLAQQQLSDGLDALDNLIDQAKEAQTSEPQNPGQD